MNGAPRVGLGVEISGVSIAEILRGWSWAFWGPKVSQNGLAWLLAALTSVCLPPIAVVSSQLCAELAWSCL